MFGSTVEHVLRSFTENYLPGKGFVDDDGSMHTFDKEFHLTDWTLAELGFKNLFPNSITTPIYPVKNAHLPEILDAIKKIVPSYQTDHRVLIHAQNIRDAELNILFQYHKMAAGKTMRLGLNLFCGSNLHNIIKWDPTYTSWEQMQPWQLREWFSMFYVGWVQEWLQSQHQVDAGTLKVTNLDILNNFASTLRKIIKHCKLVQSSSLEEFGKLWRSKQQYIVDEFELLNIIVECTINNQPLEWEPINIIAEAIVQQRLRALGYEIQCDGLNIFPTNSKTLYNLLEKV